MSSFALPTTGRRHLAPLIVACAGALTYALWLPPTTDLSDKRFRSALFGRAGFEVWDNLWFGGHHLPGYSLLVPMLGWLFGPVLLGVVACVIASILGSVLVHRLADAHVVLRHPTVAAVLFTVGCLSSLYGGRTAFLTGLMFGVAAVVAATRARPVLTGGLAALCALTSPVAGMFVALLGGALVLSRAVPRLVSMWLVIPPIMLVGAVTIMFPEGGDFPFPLGGAVNSLLVTGLVAVCGWRFSTVRWACAGYAALSVIALTFDTPIGGNAVRLGVLVAPVMVVLVPFRPRWSSPVLLVPLLALQWSPISLALTGDRTQTEAGFYAPLLAVLEDLPQPMRVEVVPVATHDEAYIVALDVPIARGWNRQVDRKLNGLFFSDAPLDERAYFEWLVDNGVSVVAIADTQLDSGGRAEATLLDRPPAYLVPLYADGVWRVFAVDPEPALAANGVTVTSIEISTVHLSATAAGEFEVKVRFSPWLRVSSGNACVSEAATGWTNLRVDEPGSIVIEGAFTWGALVDRDGDC